MIPRYKVQEISNIWSTKNKLNTWLKIELYHLDSLSCNITDKTISDEELKKIKDNIKIDIDRWKDIEKVTKHDVQAFVQMLEESIPDNAGRWIHYGLTSSDIIDTSLTLLCRESLSHIINSTASLIYSIQNIIKKDISNSEILARTHGKPAEIQTYKDVFNRWLSQTRRAYDELCIAKNKLCYGKLSGPSGNYTTNSRENERIALSNIGLKPVVSSQIISRDIYLDYFYSILKVMLAVEKISYDIRIYSIDGIDEMSEPFTMGQKGSSSMPHKKNPVSCENICGLARLYKSYFNVAVDNCLTLLERDISNSSSERIIFKDSAHIACYTLNKLSNVVSNLVIKEENAKININNNKEDINSQERMKNQIKEGKSRKDSHDNS